MPVLPATRRFGMYVLENKYAISVVGLITGVPMIPIVPGMSVQPISDCRKGV
jgi:hypothetical protein